MSTFLKSINYKRIISFLIIFIMLFNFTYLNTKSSSNSNKNGDIQNEEIILPYLCSNDLLPKKQMKFIENQGQIENSDVKYYSQDGSVWFTDEGVWFNIVVKEEKKEEIKTSSKHMYDNYQFDSERGRFEIEQIHKKGIVIKQKFVNSNFMKPVGHQKLGYYSNFFYGNISSEWKSNVPSFGEIFFANVYDGIDLIYYQNEKGLKYDFVVHPGADPDQIKIIYEGAYELEIDLTGNLVIKTPLIDVKEKNLYIYQTSNNIKSSIDGEFITDEGNIFGFKLNDKYNKRETLIIDPQIELEYSTYLGGKESESFVDIAVDSQGNTVISGSTQSPDFPTTPGVYNNSYNDFSDVFVTKINQTGTEILFSTFIGGSSSDDAFALDLSINDSIYLTGTTWSSDFPTTPGAYDTTYNTHYDIIILKLNENGSDLKYSTFFGHNNADYARDIVVDSFENIYVTGFTHSSNFPTTLGAFDRFHNQYSDCFVFKLNINTSNLIYSTFIGGGAWDYGLDIEIDTNGSAFVGGYTSSNADFPTTPGVFNSSHNGGTYDGFVLKLNKSGSNLIFSTFIGGEASEVVYGLEIDRDENVFITGKTGSSDFPTTNNAYDSNLNGTGDAFVLKLNSNASKILLSTYVGGNGEDRGYDIKLDSGGRILITGDVLSSDFPITNDAYDNTLNGTKDTFLMLLSSDFTQNLYATYLGGSSSDSVSNMVLDRDKAVYLSGTTWSDDFPTTGGVFNTTYHGNVDAFIVKFNLRPVLKITSLNLLKNDDPVIDIYSKFVVYNFKIQIIDTVSLNDLENVELFLDPVGNNIHLRWNRTSNQFTEINDPYDFVTIDQSSYASNFLSQWTLNFNLIFNWTYPDENLNDVQIYATSTSITPDWLNVTDLYRVEKDLTFYGTLIASGENNRVIEENDIVRGGEKLNWTGLKVVYENTIDIYPPQDEYDVAVWDDTGKSWFCNPEPGDNFSIQTVTPYIKDNNDFTYTINLSGIPLECDKTNTTFKIKVDSNNVEFLNPIPDNRTWQTALDIEAGITVEDSGGALVNGSCIKYSLSTDNGNVWSPWTEINSINSASIINIQTPVSLMDGRDNLIKWQAKDTVNNGPTESDEYRILIDTTNVTFSEPLPSYTEEASTESVEVGIKISDIYSGVNASTIEYSISYDEGLTWSPWTKVNNVQNANEVSVRLNLTFKNGTSNRIMWRAYDLAGTGPAKSEIYIVRVNIELETLIPKVRLLSPEDNSTLTKNSIKLEWILLNSNLNGVTYDVYVDKENPPNELEKIDLSITSLIIENLENNAQYFWTIIPKTGKDTGICISNVWSFKVNLNASVPIVTLISPENRIKLNVLKPTFSWGLEYNGSETVTYDIYLDIDIPPKRIIEGHPSTEYTPLVKLESGLKYFWSIVPVAGEIKGQSSPIWWFEIDTDYNPKIDFKLELKPNEIKVKPNEIKSVIISVTNLGELNDTLFLTYEIPENSGINIIINETGPKSLKPQGSFDFQVIITVENDVNSGEIFVIFTCSSGKAIDYGTELEKSETLKVTIIESKTNSSADLLSNSWAIGILFIVLVIIVFITLFIIFKKRKKRLTAEIEYIPPESKPVIEGGTIGQTDVIQAPTINIEQIQVTPSEGQLPSSVESDVTSQPVPSAVTAATAVSPQAITPPRPQLPPSEEEGSDTEVKDKLQATTPVVATTPLIEQPIPEESENVEIDNLFGFGMEGGPKPVEKDLVYHDVLESKTEDSPDLEASTTDLQSASVIKATDENAVIHEGDKGVWKPREKGNNLTNTRKIEETEKILTQIERLAKLKEIGLLSVEEFEGRKRELLRK